MTFSKIEKKTFLIISMLIVFSFIALYFGLLVHTSIIRADQWRFIDLYIYPIVKNTFDLSLLWNDHHPQPLTAILFIWSKKYFDLTINMYFYVGIIGKILFISFFTYLLNKSTQMSVIKTLIILLVISTFLSLKSFNEYGWPLVTLSNIWLFILLVLFFYIDKLYKNFNISDYLIVYILITFLLIMVKDTAIIYIASLFSILLLISLIDKQYNKIISYILVLTMSFTTFKLFFFLIEVQEDFSNKLLFNLETFNILGACNSYAIALLSGLLKVESLKEIDLNEYTILTIAYLVTFLYLLTIIYYVKNKIYKVTLVPLSFMIGTLTFITAVVMYRFYPDSSAIQWAVVSPRYTKIYEVGIISMFWSLLLISNKKIFSNLQKKIFIIIILIIVIMNIYYIFSAFHFSKYLINSNIKSEKALQDYSKNREDTIPKYIRGSYFSDDKVDFLKRNHLNVFSKKYEK